MDNFKKVWAPDRETALYHLLGALVCCGVLTIGALKIVGAVYAKCGPTCPCCSK